MKKKTSSIDPIRNSAFQSKKKGVIGVQSYRGIAVIGNIISSSD